MERAAWLAATAAVVAAATEPVGDEEACGGAALPPGAKLANKSSVLAACANSVRPVVRGSLGAVLCIPVSRESLANPLASVLRPKRSKGIKSSTKPIMNCKEFWLSSCVARPITMPAASLWSSA